MDIQSLQEFYDFASLNVTQNMISLLDLSEKPALKKYAAILLHAYATNSKFSKIQIERFIKSLGPKLLLE